MEIILYPKYLIQRMFAHDRRGFFSAGYKLLYPECSRRGMTPWQHYVLEGKRKGFDDGNHPPEAFFFREGYELEYPDVKAAGVDPWRHYADKGASEGRDNGNHPQAGQFFAEGYLEMYPDMAKSGMDPWRHYVLKGRKEGRDNGLHPDDEEFFEEGYLEMYPDTAKSGMDPWHHYVLKGRKKGRDNGLHPDGKKFFAEGYLEMYPDAAKTGMDPWRHYVLKGKNAGLDNGHHPNPGQFFAEGYLGMYPDAAKSGMDPWHHYVLKGRKEGRDSGLHPDGKKFFAEGYLEMYPDAAKTGMDPWHHYVLKGCKEGRDNGHHPDKTMFFPEGYKCNYPCCTSEPYGSDLWMNYIKIGKAAKRNNGLLPAGPFFYAGYLERHPHGSIAEAWKDYVLNSLKAPDKDMYLYPDGNWVRASLWSIKPSVAVIMPVSNSRDTVMQAIRSVLDQSWPYWHLYAAADSSDDGILEFLKSAVSDPRIILLTSGREGVPSARSTAVRHMGNEDYVAYLDPGHTWNREYLELMLCRLLETHSCCCYCAMKKSVKSGGGTAMVQEFLYDPFDIHRLLESDYIDLNVLMHRAGVFEETGVFDPSLRGMVGWDFVLSLAQRYPFSALPYAGCSCEIEEVKEQTVQNGSFSQRCLNAVRGRHLPDWNFLAEKKGSRDDRLVSVIIYFSRNDSVTFLENCLKSLKNARAYGHSKYRTEIILVDDSCSERGHSAVLRFYKESLADYILSRTGCGFPLGCSMALSLAHGSFTVFLDSQAYVSADWLDHLIDPLKRHHALKGTTAKVLQPDGVINSAGCLFDTVSGLPYGALHELPAGSAAAGRITMMPSVSSSCSAFRTSDIIARKGLYCIYASGIAIPDLCLQLGGGRACFAFIPSSSVVCPADAHPLLPDDFEFFAERWSGHIIFGEQEYFARRKLCGSMKSGEAAYSVPFNKEPNTDRAGCPAGCSVPACDFSGTGCGIRLSSEQQSVIRRIKSFSREFPKNWEF